MGLLFKDDFHDKFGTWPLAYIPYGGPDFGEILAVARAVGDVTMRLTTNPGSRPAGGVLKKRMTDFEKTLREFEISRYGIKVGKPLIHLRGLLTGVPEFLADEP